MIYLVLVLWALVCLCPLYWLAIASLKEPAALVYGPVYVPGLDFSPTLNAWREVMDTGDLARRCANTAVIAASSTALTVLASVLALYAGRQIRLLPALMITRVIPPIAVIVPTYLAGSALGLLDTRSLLIGVYTALNLPVALWLLRPVFDRRLKRLEEAAMLDGASRLRTLVDIVLPATVRPVAGVAIFVLALCWNEYLLATFLTGSKAQTLPPFLVGQISVREQQAGSDPDEVARLAAVAVIMALPPMVLFALVQRAIRNAAIGQ